MYAAAARTYRRVNAQGCYYLAGRRRSCGVGVQRATSWAATTPTLLVKEGVFTTIPAGRSRPHFTILPLTVCEFLMIKEGDGSDQTAAPSQIIVGADWVEELKRLVPTK